MSTIEYIGQRRSIELICLDSYHHIKICPAKVLSCCVNRSQIPIIDEVGTHYTACDKVNRCEGHIEFICIRFMVWYTLT